MPGGIAVHALMHVQKTCVTQVYRACMRMDERGHRLQGDEQPEHQ
jgi:hypothetical protein